MTMFSHKILQWFCIAFRIKCKFYKVFKILRFPIRTLFSATSEYLQFFEYITFPLVSCLCIYYHFCIIIFSQSLLAWLLLVWQVADLTAPNLGQMLLYGVLEAFHAYFDHITCHTVLCLLFCLHSRSSCSLTSEKTFFSIPQYLEQCQGQSQF